MIFNGTRGGRERDLCSRYIARGARLRKTEHTHLQNKWQRIELLFRKMDQVRPRGSTLPSGASEVHWGESERRRGKRKRKW